MCAFEGLERKAGNFEMEAEGSLNYEMDGRSAQERLGTYERSDRKAGMSRLEAECQELRLKVAEAIAVAWVHRSMSHGVLSG